jgi:hypothetical protein
MSKQILSEEFKRMQKLAGIINENEYPVKLGEPHPSAVYPAGDAYHTLSTGTSVDIGEDPYHYYYKELTSEEHQEVIDLLNNYIKEYIKKFGNTKYYNKDVVNLAKDIVEKHQKKLAGLINENQMNTNMKLFDLKDENNESTELYRIENFTNVEDAINKLNQHLNTDGLYTVNSGTDYNYVYVAGDGNCHFVKSLDEFDEGFKTEEEWGVSKEELLN